MDDFDWGSLGDYGDLGDFDMSSLDLGGLDVGGFDFGDFDVSQMSPEALFGEGIDVGGLDLGSLADEVAGIGDISYDWGVGAGDLSQLSPEDFGAIIENLPYESAFTPGTVFIDGMPYYGSPEEYVPSTFNAAKDSQLANEMIERGLMYDEFGGTALPGYTDPAQTPGTVTIGGKTYSTTPTSTVRDKFNAAKDSEDANKDLGKDKALEGYRDPTTTPPKVTIDDKTYSVDKPPVTNPPRTPGTGTNKIPQQKDLLSTLLPLLLMMMAMNKDKSGGASSAVIPALTATQKQTPYTQIQQAPGYRPGQGGITYFNPVQYTPRMASGGIVTLAEGGGLSKDSTAQEIADAYKSYIGTAGGDRPETQAAAVNFLRDLGIGDETIMSGYQTFLGNPPASTAANTAATTAATEGASTTQAPPVDYATQILNQRLAELGPAAYQEEGSVPYRVRELVENALKGIMPESEADRELLNRQLFSSTALRDAAGRLGYDYDKEGIGSLLTNVNFNQRDPRNWIEIFRAADPIAAARAATGQAIMGGAFSNADPRERAYQSSPVARSGNVGLFEVSTPSGTYLQPRFLTPEGLIKGNAYTSSDIGGFTTGARNLGLGVTQADIDALKAKAAAYYASTSKPRGYDAGASMSFLSNLKPIQSGYSGNTPNYLIPGMNPSIYSGVEWSPNAAPTVGMAGGGIIDLARALAAKRREQRQGLLKGRGDGVSDSIPAMIGKDQPARLARGEYVVDARTVAELGNGSTDAGAERLDEMRKRVHAKRRKAKVGEDSGAHKVLPA